jgi:hypothetical protein
VGDRRVSEAAERASPYVSQCSRTMHLLAARAARFTVDGTVYVPARRARVFVPNYSI